MKDAYYFSHDAYARHDSKLAAMRATYGLKGYGLYWMLIEMMREADGYKISISGKHDYKVISKQAGCTKSVVKKFIEDCIVEFGIFETDGESIWRLDFLARMSKMNELREKKKAAANKRWDKKGEIPEESEDKGDPGAVHLDSTRIPDVMQRKEMESKEIKPDQIKGQETEFPEGKFKENISLESRSDKSDSNSSRKPTGLRIPTLSLRRPATDEIAIQNKPREEILVWYENRYFFVSLDYLDVLTDRFQMSKDDIMGALHAMETDSRLDTYEGSYKEFIEEYLSGIPDIEHAHA